MIKYLPNGKVDRSEKVDRKALLGESFTDTITDLCDALDRANELLALSGQDREGNSFLGHPGEPD